MAEIATLEWFKDHRLHHKCLVCGQLRAADNNIFCYAHYRLYNESPELKEVKRLGKKMSLAKREARGEFEAIKREGWLAFANRQHAPPRCLCGGERDTDDYLCPDCRASLITF